MSAASDRLRAAIESIRDDDPIIAARLRSMLFEMIQHARAELELVRDANQARKEASND